MIAAQNAKPVKNYGGAAKKFKNCECFPQKNDTLFLDSTVKLFVVRREAV